MSKGIKGAIASLALLGLGVFLGREFGGSTGDGF